jgi:hypothetical protein
MAEIKTKHGLPETKGQFKLRGNATGLQRDNAFKPINTKSGKKMRILNFGVETAPESTVYVTLQGMERDEVYYGKRSEVKGQKGETRKVAWADRHTPPGEGFRLMGIAVGLEKGEDGKNVTNTHAEFDAAEEVYNNLNDDTPVFVRGDIEFSSFKRDNGEVSRNKKFAIKNIYGSNDIDFDAEDFAETSEFKQKIIFMGIEKADDKNDPHFVLEAQIVTYGSIEQTDFTIRNNALANQFRKVLQPYNAIDVWGKIYNKVDTDDVQDTPVAAWGEEDSFKKVTKNYIRELMIVGADPESIDTETYTEESIEKAVKKLNSQGQVEKKEKVKKDSSDDAWGEGTDIKDDDLPW